jgi:ribosomal protein S18 acetylase RimI-like enzyme
MKRIEIRLVDQWDTQEIINLYKAGNWWKEHYDASKIPHLIRSSFSFAIAIDTANNKAIAMGRSISDGVSDAYIQDVIVLPEYRRQEIGKHIIEKLVQQCHASNIQWIGLIAEPGSIEFYTTLDFKPMKDHVPMLLKTEDS